MIKPRSSPSETTRVHASLISVQLLFALWPVAGALMLTRMPSTALIGLRLGLGAPLLAWMAGIFRPPYPSARDLAVLAGLAMLGISGNQLLFAEGLAKSGPVNASVAVLLIPPLTIGAALLLGRERLSWRRLSGVAIALAGGLFLVGAERVDGSSDVLIGNAMLVANTSSYALYLVLAGPILKRLDSLRAVAWVMLLGALEALPLTLGPTLRVDFAGMPASHFAALGFIVIGPTIFTYRLNAWALARADASLVASYVYIQPPIAALAAFLLLDVTPTARVVAAGCIIAAGVFVATRSGARRPKDPPVAKSSESGPAAR